MYKYTPKIVPGLRFALPNGMYINPEFELTAEQYEAVKIADPELAKKFKESKKVELQDPK
jgi:hypothetical protein